MNYLKLPLVILLAIGLTGVSSVASTAQVAAQGTTALERGYRTGYSDGYTAGYSDIANHAARDYQNKEDYKQADRSYNQSWGTIDDYRDGYQQGFEGGYAAGYERAQFDSTLPAGFKRRGAKTVDATTADNTNATSDTSNDTAIAVNKTDVDPTATKGRCLTGRVV